MIKFFRKGHFQLRQVTDLGQDQGVVAAAEQQGPDPQGKGALEFRAARQPVIEQVNQSQERLIIRRVLDKRQRPKTAAGILVAKR